MMSNKLSIEYLNQLKNSLFKISKSVHDYDNIDQLYKTIHECIVDLVHTNNFYIALVDWGTEILTFPYFVDERDDQPIPKKLGNGLTEYVLKKEESILLNKDLILTSPLGYTTVISFLSAFLLYPPALLI